MRLMPKNLWIALFFLIQYYPSASAQLRVGLLPFSGIGIDSTQCTLVTSKFQDALVSAGTFDLIEQEHFEKIVQEHEFAASGCLDLSCYVSFGRKVGVQKMIAGKIALIGDMLSISVRIINIETGAIEKVAMHDTRSSAVELSNEEMAGFVERFVGKANAQKDVYAFDFQGTEPAIAVLELIANGVDKNVVAGLSDRLRIELFNSGKFRVMEREQMQTILHEQAFQQSGCLDQQCAVEVGRLINVSYMVGGSITRINNTFSLSTRIIDVETGKIVRTASQDISGDIQHLLHRSLPELARGLAGLAPRRRVPPVSIVSGGATLLCGAATTGFFLLANQSHQHYLAEHLDPQQVTHYRTLTEQRVVAGQILAATTAAAALTTLLPLIVRREKISIQNAQLTVLPSIGTDLYACSVRLTW